ncbi:MAG: pyridoxamine 5'-phosphate oxidase family protein [Christensenellaceae bacterium]|nr:pyridoxamine 5'-phosphate oxidase family protein [Christensenellaceae bacterium]
MNEVYSFLKECGAYYLATVEDGQPRVRPFGSIDIFDGKLLFLDGKTKDVSKQLHKEPRAEICAFNGTTWLRICFRAVEFDNTDAQSHMLEAYPNLKAMYAPGDGNIELFAITEATATFASFTAAPRSISF